MAKLFTPKEDREFSRFVQNLHDIDKAAGEAVCVHRALEAKSLWRGGVAKRATALYAPTFRAWLARIILG